MRKPKSRWVNTMAKHCTFLFHPSILTYFSYAFSQTRSQKNASTLQKIRFHITTSYQFPLTLKNLNREIRTNRYPARQIFRERTMLLPFCIWLALLPKP